MTGPVPAGAGGVDRETAMDPINALAVELGVDAFLDTGHNGLDCHDVEPTEEVVRAVLTAALPAILPAVEAVVRAESAAALAAAEQRADTAEAALSAVRDALMQGGQTEAIRAQQARFALSSRPVQPESEQR